MPLLVDWNVGRYSVRATIRKHSAMRCFKERLLGDRSCPSVVLLGELESTEEEEENFL